MNKVNIYPTEGMLDTSSKVTIKLKNENELFYEYDLNSLINIEDRKNKMKVKTSSLLGKIMSDSLWKFIESEETLPSEWIWDNYNKNL